MTTQTTTINPSCNDDHDLPVGTIVHVAFDGRGLARITGHEDDGIHIITFVDDPQRTSEHVTAGESVGATRADMTVVQLAAAAPEASGVEGEGATAVTFAVAVDVALTVTGRPGDWTVWSTDSADELVFAGKSDREKAHSAASDVHDALVDERIRAAGLQEMARADRAAAAALAARMQTTQGLWDALRATTVPATKARTRTRGKRGGRGRLRGANAGSAAASTATVTKASPTATATAAKSAGKRRGRRGARKPTGGATATTPATQKTASPAPARRSTRRPRRNRPETVAAQAAAATATVSATEAVTATAVPSAPATTVVVSAAAVAPAPPTPTTTRRPTVTRTPAVPAPRVDDGGDSEVAETQWAVYTQVDVVGGMSANVVGRVGLLGDALSETLRAVLGDREAGRVRKAMRAGGLITGPTVIQEPAPRALRIACAPLRASDAQRLRALADTEISTAVKASVDTKTAGTKARPLASR